MNLSEAILYPKEMELKDLENDSRIVKKSVHVHICTTCHRRIYADTMNKDGSWNSSWRGAWTKTGYILLCGKCSVDYDLEELILKAERQGWATISYNGNLRTIRTTFLLTRLLEPIYYTGSSV